MAKYHTEGIVKDVELRITDGIFTLEAAAPFSIDEKSSGLEEKAILFVSENDDPTTERFNQVDSDGADPTTKPILRDAFLVTSKVSFKFRHSGRPVDTASLLILKQNRSKLRVVIDGDRNMTTMPLSEPIFTVSSIIIR